MRKSYVWIATLAMLWSWSLLVQSATFNADQVRSHGSWASMKLSLGKQRFYRAINSSDYSDLRLMVDFDAQECEPRLEIQLDGNQSFGESKVIGYPEVAIRVDRKPIHDSVAELSTVSGDITVYGTILVGDLPGLISEMRLGRMLRMKFSPAQEGKQPVYVELSLNGSKAALDRTASLCQEEQDRPEDYFEGSDELGDDEASSYF